MRMALSPRLPILARNWCTYAAACSALIALLLLCLCALRTQHIKRLLNHACCIHSLRLWIHQLASHYAENLIMNSFELSIAFFLADLQLSLVQDLENDVIDRDFGAEGFG